MEKVLNQEEIDAMFRAARSGAAVAAPDALKPQLTVTRCNLQGSPLRKEQVRAISTLHEGYARNLTHSLGAYLRVLFDVNLVSVEQLLYREFLGRVPDLVYLASVNLAPDGGVALLQMDLSLAFVIIDLLLGGQGQPPATLRDLTEIEDEILESVVRVLCRELSTTWQTVGIATEFDERQVPAAAQHLMPPTDKSLALSFEIRVADARGALNFVFPASASTVLLRKLARDGRASGRRPPASPSGVYVNFCSIANFWSIWRCRPARSLFSDCSKSRQATFSHFPCRQLRRLTCALPAAKVSRHNRCARAVPAAQRYWLRWLTLIQNRKRGVDRCPNR